MTTEIAKNSLKDNEEELKEKTKKLSIKEGSAWAVQDGTGIRYITPYALAIGQGNPHINIFIGFLSSIPGLIATFSQLFTSRLMEKFSRKKIISTAVFFQAMMWLSIIFVGILFFILHTDSNISLALLITFYTILALFGACAGPIWTSWMKDIVTKDSGKYFGRRNRIIGFVSLVSTLIAGFILDYFKKTNLFLGFAILFSIAFIFRLISAYLFTKKYEPELKLEKDYYFSFKQFLKKLPENNYGKFTIFVSLLSFSVAVASPFFAVYMLQDLGFGYLKWTIVTIASSIFSLIFMSIWGKFIDNYGTQKTMMITGALIPIIPFLWLSSPIIISPIKLFVYLFFIESLSGAVWAGFNLATSNFTYDCVTRQRIAICSTYFNILNAIGAAVGATLGGFISSRNFTFLGLKPILIIFLLSGIFRLIIYLMMMGKIKEVREVKEFNLKSSTKKNLKNLNLII